MPGRTEVAIGILLTCLLAIATDLRARKIPNWLTLTSMAAGILCSLLFQGLPAFLQSLLGIGAGLLAYLPFFLLGWLGGGDVKLLMAFGAWGGAWFALDSAVNSVVVGGVLALGSLVLRGTLFGFLRRFWQFLRSILYRELVIEPFKVDPHARLPFAIPMGLAAIGRLYGKLPGVVEWFGR